MSGSIYIIHSPKPIPRFRPVGELRYFSAIALGGVPIGVPIPPMLAATGIESVKATRPLPSGGSALNTGARKVSIIAAVAVLLTNIENTPVMRMKPSSTFSLLLPKGLSSVRAKSTSSPDFVAAIASMKPPRKRMMIGSANVAISALWSSSSSFSMPDRKKWNALSDVVKSSKPMSDTDVAQGEMASVTHSIVANANTAIMRCWITVRPSIPKLLVGRFHNTIVTRTAKAKSRAFFLLKSPLRRFLFSVAIKFFVG